ncbi:clavesin-2-like [Melitaea cinxia]|uniref:clavesin-2-like n=1 Tax=Melitaea cinxia TaxID=113334 RepID=UPI001E27231F|nr:clavesin-2-like [Melitaea cinxia]
MKITSDKMSCDYSRDVTYIREWMSKEPYLPQDFDDYVLTKFIHSCSGSLESTKKCLDRFCSTRRQMSEIYTFRDPLAANLQDSFSATVVAYYKFENSEFFIHKYDDPTYEKLIFYDILKALMIQADHWIKYRQFIADGHYVIIDMEHYSLKMVPKVNIMYFRDFLIYLLEGMPVILKKVIAVNAPSYYDKLYALIKPALPSEICDLVHFYPNYEGLYKHIDKKYLPSEYGGEAESMYEKSRNLIKEINEERKFFLNEELWKADLKKKPKHSTNGAMNGSFKALAID